MGVLSSLEPKEVFFYFEEISSIPRASYHEEAISNYCVEFAKKHQLEYIQDELKNVIIIKEATPGYEQEEPIIMQGHLDMVCEKLPECDIDFDTEGIRLLIEGDDVTADGTTLGGDNGIAIAYALAVLASDKIAHPRLEVIFTVSEEVGMEGAEGIDVSMLKGRRLLNLDSEEEGILLAGCAGAGEREVMSDVQRRQRDMAEIDPMRELLEDKYGDCKETGGEIAFVSDGSLSDEDSSQALYEGIQIYALSAGVSHGGGGHKADQQCGVYPLRPV